MSHWQTHDLENKVLAILRDEPYHAPEHHLGRPFLTAYQIAIEFAHRHPEVFTELGLPLGGLGTGKHNSLAQYLAGELSRRVKNRSIPVEGGFLSNWHLNGITFGEDENIVTSSLTGTAFTLSMFRLRED